MKITSVRPKVVFGAWRNWVYVEVHTDEGFVGLGEATMEGKEKAVVGAIEDLERALVGEDPTRIEHLWSTLYRDSYFRKGPVLSTALGSIDVALWDILGRVHDVPVHRLLGGPIRTRIPAYANGWYFGAKTPDAYAERAAETVKQGFRALKFDPFGTSEGTIDRTAERFALECVEQVRAAVGPDVAMMIEGHGRFYLTTAVRLAHALEPYDIMWFEEPLPPDHFRSIVEFSRTSPIPLASGERCFARHDFIPYFEAGALAYAQPDVLHVGGITEARKIAAMADAYGLPVFPHNAAGPVGTAATLQIAAIASNFGMLEFFVHDAPWRDEICTPAIVVEDGLAHLPEGPGLGLVLDHSVADAHPYQARDLFFFSEESTLNVSPLQGR